VLLTTFLWGSVLPVAESSGWGRAIRDNDTQTLWREMPGQDGVDAPDERGKTALMAAAASNDAKLVAALLARGADPSRSNRNGGTALIYAAWSGSLEATRQLLAAGAKPDTRAGNGWTALMMSAAKNRPRVARALLEAGADANIPDVYAWTPLMRAAYAGHPDVLQILLGDERTDLERVNDHGQTALHLALIGRRWEAVRSLSRAGAHWDRADFSGRTATDLARELDMPGLPARGPETGLSSGSGSDSTRH
jgi:ankyrin repeat protein